MSNVLVVEDDADSRELMVRALTRAGHVASAVANGREALDAVMREGAVVDLIVLDVRMPVMDGVEFMKVVRAYLRFQTVPVVVVTAITDGMELERVRAYDIARVFTKANFDLADFIACVDKLARFSHDTQLPPLPFEPQAIRGDAISGGSSFSR